MYLTFYGLKKEPFHTTPDPNFLYLSPTHKEAFGAIIYGIEQRKGFIAITGEVGVGKTTIIRAYLERPTTRKQKTIYIFNPVVSFHALVTTIFRSLEVTPAQSDLPDMVTQLHEILIAEYRANSTVVLVIDEAQNMPIETLENLRMLSNLETASDKLIQIVLIGQPELNTLLDDPKLKALKQRIALRANICPLNEKESQAYIEHRVNLVSRTGNSLFTKDALKLITQQAQGVPRRLNILCDNALITGYGRQRNPVTAKEVREILPDFEGNGVGVFSRWPYVAAIAIALAIGSVFLVSSFLPSNGGLLKTSGGKGGQSSVLEEEASSQRFGSTGEASEHFSAASTSHPSSAPSPDDPGNDMAQSRQPGTPLAKVETRVTTEEQGTESPMDNGRGISSPSDSTNRHRGTFKDSLMKSEKKTEEETSADPMTGSPFASQSGRPSEFEQLSLRGAERSVEQNAVPPSSSRTRLVKKGESLSKIAKEMYGSDDPKYINWVRNHNEGIIDPDFILPGQQIILPEYLKE